MVAMSEKAAEFVAAPSAPAPSPLADAALSARRERFCRYYLTEPSATRAAVKAGYSENGAGQAGHRLLKNVEILQRIDAIRRSEHLVYELSPQAVMDRCEALFEEALEKGRYEGAIGALRLQAKIGGLLRHDALPATKRDLAGAIDYSVRAAVSKYVAFGTLGSAHPLAPPPWAPGEEAARRTRRKMDNELDGGGADAAPNSAALEAEGGLAWPGDEASLLRAAVGHEDEFRRADGLEPVTPALPRWAPDEIRAETERAYALGRAPGPDDSAPRRGFPPDDGGTDA